MKKFSLLIAHFCNYDFFVECYESIKSQTFQDFEVILVDDCSTDDSLEKIKILTKDDSRIKIFKNETNKGVGFTKRKCVEMAQGEICGFLDPDDALRNDALEISLKQYSDSKIIATHSQIMMCDQKLSPLNLFKNTKAVKANNSKFFNINFEVNHFFTFKRSIYLETSGINENLTSAVDQDLYLKIYDKGILKYIEEPIYLYRKHESGVSQDKSKKSKLVSNWNIVLKDTLKRRNISTLYGKKVNEIEDLATFIYKKQNSYLAKFLKKFS
ncbi:glycosyltransferase family 2 protein [Halpernia frigidisoli]|uniref:Glycosyltransferase involved in cell wall bisynthesis n=1 Tax=Halpernia frigidisoli TaxID=1125876 RepID=A0A1I3GMS3_9FLAO|nr:glycosyltransferase family 2 protein [Halpernia frigidisoli]SFI24562.1 Glycosyltransferase involved in cell wall bisynthesis [Halpernia frigidisoli]